MHKLILTAAINTENTVLQQGVGYNITPELVISFKATYVFLSKFLAVVCVQAAADRQIVSLEQTMFSPKQRS